MIDASFFAKLDALSLTLRRQSFGKYQGEQKTAYVGDGLTFKDYAPYMLGDDFRRIDWTVYARTKELYVRRYEADKNLTMHLLLDNSASMNYGKGKHTKFAYGAHLALGLLHVGMKHQERVELSLFNEKITPLKFQNQQVRIQEIVSNLTYVKPNGSGDFGTVLKQYRNRVKSKSLIFIISDFLYSPDQLKALLSQYHKSQLFLIQVLHEDEAMLPFIGDTRFIDPENTESSVKAYVTSGLQKRYQRELIKHTLRIKNGCGKNATFMQFNTRQKPIESFLKMWDLF